MESVHYVQYETQDGFIYPQAHLKVSWILESVIPPLQSPDSFLVDILLTQFNPITEQWEDLVLLAAGINNTGQTEMDVPTILATGSSTIRSALVTLQVRLRQLKHKLIDEATDAIDEATDAIDEATDVLRNNVRQFSCYFVSLPENIVDANNFLDLRTTCEEWCMNQDENIGQMILDELPPCPPRLNQASRENSGLERELQCSVDIYHAGAEACFRGTQVR